MAALGDASISCEPYAARLAPGRHPVTGAPGPTPTRLTDAEWAAIEAAAVPHILWNRLLSQAFSTATHGYSTAVLRRQCERARAAAIDHETPAVLVIWTGSSTIIGAFLSSVFDWRSKRPFTGNSSTCVFRLVRGQDADGAAGRCEAFGAAEDGNGRFMRVDSTALTVGGGPAPTIRLVDELQTVRCAAPSATFADLVAPLLPATEPGVTVDPVDGAVVGKVAQLELIVLQRDNA